MIFFTIVLCIIILIGLFLICLAGGIALVMMGINTIKYSDGWDDIVFGITFIILAFLLFLNSLSPLVAIFILL